MKRWIIKRFAYLLLIALMGNVAACSKKNEAAVPGTIGGTDTVPNAGEEDVFAPQTPGITVKKVDFQQGNIDEYFLYIPDTYNEKKTYKWPVVIFLHGATEIGTDIEVIRNLGLMKVVKGKQFVMVTPQCTASWWNTETLQRLYKEVMEKYHVDSTRVYLTGLSMGGYGTWSWAQTNPDQFAAIVPICGVGTPAQACVLDKMPVWAFHNADDPQVTVSASRDMVNALKKCGSNLVKYTEKATGGHDAWTNAYADPALYTWLLDQKR
ncbi:carboxylesterase family protein [Chitinophaga rhizophila]|uniref:Prolyl oligopeptidase family serine peptidase n=1 Tax=Chitinophaga rhizophila TaxID=2866212 RepID=A0ABS7GCU1_9BACT|nr:prolyl oligopeptidase family serine peptidase [Chitinophaga rhizophila]MBW8685493.1 prolyl oligopeptidase family serine peptidase [Chitinophaga rhizophila]